ncbi:MAG TPA: LuxR C-terminal-related transcriptional regulator [Ktedonobacterales bacterium]
MEQERKVKPYPRQAPHLTGGPLFPIPAPCRAPAATDAPASRASIPRGPRPSTRANHARLTSREVEVLLLLAEGRSNAEIACRLFTSPKTADHQVSAILSKLEVHSRAQAITAAAALGLLPSLR